jgi:hypothetical protein
MDETRDRETIQQAYIRVCRDSGFGLSFDRAAHLAGKMLGMSALEIWLAMPCMDVMMNIATGKHPAAHRPHPNKDQPHDQ